MLEFLSEELGSDSNSSMLSEPNSSDRNSNMRVFTFARADHTSSRVVPKISALMFMLCRNLMLPPTQYSSFQKIVCNRSPAALPCLDGLRITDRGASARLPLIAAILLACPAGGRAECQRASEGAPGASVPAVPFPFSRRNNIPRKENSFVCRDASKSCSYTATPRIPSLHRQHFRVERIITTSYENAQFDTYSKRSPPR